MQFDSKQLRVIEASGSDILVSASAGSGKTTVMIERIIRLIEQGASLSRMLIVTFTKAAAADMRAKLFKALLERPASPSLRRALKELPTADISTLHSFCGKLARTYFYAIELDPAFELLGDSDGALFERCLDEAVENVSGGVASELYEIMLASRKDKPFRFALKRVYEAAVASPDPRGWLNSCLDCCIDDTKARKVVFGELEKDRKTLLKWVDECMYETECAGFTRNLVAVRELKTALETGDPLVISRSPGGKVPPLYFDLNEKFKFLKDRVKKYFERENEVKNLTPSKSALPVANSLKESALVLMDIYEREKQKNAVADYNDLEHFAYDILRSSAGAGIRESYDYIFVDEYQDINPLQDAIISLIKRDNNLFMVGDLKQSIYAFRGCEPAIFAGKGEKFKEGAGLNVELNANFRTCPEIVENVNRVFSSCMSREFGGVDYDSSARLVPARTDTGAFRYVDIVTGDGEKDESLDEVYRLSRHEGETATAADEESDFIVIEILGLLDNKELSPSDIAVLTRTKSKLSYLIRDKLSAAGVPACVKEAGNAAVLPETAPLIAMLRLTENYADDIPLVTALSSYIGKLTSDELASIAESADIDEPFFSAARRSEKAALFFEKLERYTLLSQSVSAGELLSVIAEDCDAFTEAEKMSGSGHTGSNISALISSCGDLTVSQLLERLDTGSEDEKAFPDGSLKIMTVHMSKGLEFEHVFLAGVDRAFNRKDFLVPYYIDRRWGIAMKSPDGAEHVWKSTFLTEAARLTLRHRRLEEEMRIMYVAMTRAKRSLTVSGCNIGESDSLKRAFSLPARPSDFLYALTPEKIDVERERAECATSRAKPVFAGSESKLSARLERLINFVYPQENKQAKTTVTAAAHALPEEFDGYYVGKPTAFDDVDAAFRGTAFHLFMRRLDYEKPFALQRALFETEFPEEAKAVDFEKARSAAEKVAKLVSGKKLYREKEFIIDEGGTLVQGVIDLMAVGEDGVIVVDYKTGLNVKRASYRRQLELYGGAIEKILHKKVEGLYVCALDIGDIYDAKTFPE